jgi:hypothetical protein
MRQLRQSLSSIVILLTLSTLVFADTLYLRNGSVLKGTFVGFENGYFLFQMDGDEENKPRRFAVRDVTRLMMDRNTQASNPYDNRGNYPNSNTAPRNDTRSGGFETLPQFDVQLLDQWIKSDVQVTRGQRVRIEASGQISLDSRTSSRPEGLNRRDPDAPLPNENDGALVAAIGTDYDSPPILIGRSREFTADRDGLLYFTVNHASTAGTRGSYQVRVSLDRSTGSTYTSGNTAPRDDRNNSSASQNWSERELAVSASQQWVDTGIEVQPGMALDISASGTINTGNGRRTSPDGDTSQQGSYNLPVRNAATGMLLAKIRYSRGGESIVVPVGSSRRLNIEANEYGRLLLGINDDYVGDNTGTFNVRVHLAR